MCSCSWPIRSKSPIQDAKQVCEDDEDGDFAIIVDQPIGPKGARSSVVGREVTGPVPVLNGLASKTVPKWNRADSWNTA